MYQIQITCSDSQWNSLWSHFVYCVDLCLTCSGCCWSELKCQTWLWACLMSDSALTQNAECHFVLAWFKDSAALFRAHLVWIDELDDLVKAPWRHEVLCSSSFKMMCGVNNTLFGSFEDRAVSSFVICSLRGMDKHFDTYPLLSRTPRSLIPQSLTACVLANHLSWCPYEKKPTSLSHAKWTNSHENRWDLWRLSDSLHAGPLSEMAPPKHLMCDIWK